MSWTYYVLLAYCRKIVRHSNKSAYPCAVPCTQLTAISFCQTLHKLAICKLVIVNSVFSFHAVVDPKTFENDLRFVLFFFSLNMQKCSIGLCTTLILSAVFQLIIVEQHQLKTIICELYLKSGNFQR